MVRFQLTLLSWLLLTISLNKLSKEAKNVSSLKTLKTNQIRHFSTQSVLKTSKIRLKTHLYHKLHHKDQETNNSLSQNQLDYWIVPPIIIS